jgi:hypothetical protein
MKIIVQDIISLLIMVTLIINNKKHDSRTKCYIAIDCVSIGLLFRKYNMIDIAWWERIPHNEPKLKITDECNRVKTSGISTISCFWFLPFIFFCDS